MKAIFTGTAGGTVTASSPSSSLLIENDGRYLMIDMGSGVMMELVRLGMIDHINDVVLTHFHADHTADAGIAVHDRLIKMQLGVCDTPITFWTPDDGAKRSFIIDGCSAQKDIKAGDRLTVAGLTVEFYRSEHAVECLSVKVSDGKKSLFYTSDGALTDELTENIGESSVVIAECSLYRDIDGRPMGHMNALDAAELRKRIKADMLWLTHLPVYGNNDELLDPAREQGLTGIRLAEKGLTIEIQEKQCR